jgi:hypothetical protein
MCGHQFIRMFVVTTNVVLKAVDQDTGPQNFLRHPSLMMIFIPNRLSNFFQCITFMICRNTAFNVFPGQFAPQPRGMHRQVFPLRARDFCKTSESPCNAPENSSSAPEPDLWVFGSFLTATWLLMLAPAVS